MGNCCIKKPKKFNSERKVMFVEDLIAFIDSILKEEEEEPYKSVFDQVDDDGDGKLNEGQLGVAIERLIGYKPSTMALKRAIFAKNQGECCSIEFPEFLSLIRSLAFLTDAEKNARKAFIDSDKDSDGYITLDEMQAALNTLDVKISEKDLIRLVDECVDQNIDRRIDRGEFLMLYQRISSDAT